MTELVPTPDGRELEVLVTGPADGPVLLFHHGTPQAAVPFPLLEREAAARGLRVVTASRPGYGRSTPRPDGATTATVADDVTDTATVLDHLGVGDFLTVGWSGGGPRALGCAARLPDRCRGAACCVGIAPHAGWPGGGIPGGAFPGDVRDGMGEENVTEYTAALAGPDALDAHLAGETALFTVTGPELAEQLGSLAPPVDRAALTGELAGTLAAAFRHAGAQGTRGWRDDDLTHLRPWGFDLAAVTVPVAVWQGREDTMVPLAHAEHLAATVAGARPHLVDGEGHLSLLTSLGGILDDLLAHARP
ncbi:alpha/beta hydrolase [Rhodococcus aerolatus]